MASGPPEKRKRLSIREERPCELLTVGAPTDEVQIRWPADLRPYDCQWDMLRTSTEAFRTGKNALIESPTGTGKTIALLSAACAFVEHEKQKRRRRERAACPVHGRGPPVSETDGPSGTCPQVPSVVGRSSDSAHPPNPGQLADPNPSTSSVAASAAGHTNKSAGDALEVPEVPLEVSPDVPPEAPHSGLCTCSDQGRKSGDPRVIWCSRTHSQLEQTVADEFDRSPYAALLRHTILAARQHLCVNEAVLNGRTAINQACKTLCDGTALPGKPAKNCGFFENLNEKYPKRDEESAKALRVEMEEGLEGRTAWLSENLKTALLKAEAPICPHKAATLFLPKDADIIFCPFNYVLDPMIRSAVLSDDLMENSVVVLDEAHNVEDLCRDVMSFHLSDEEVFEVLFSFKEKEELLTKEIAKILIPHDARVRPEEFREELIPLLEYAERLYEWIVDFAKRTVLDEHLARKEKRAEDPRADVPRPVNSTFRHDTILEEFAEAGLSLEPNSVRRHTIQNSLGKVKEATYMRKYRPKLGPISRLVHFFGNFDECREAFDMNISMVDTVPPQYDDGEYDEGADSGGRTGLAEIQRLRNKSKLTKEEERIVEGHLRRVELRKRFEKLDDSCVVVQFWCHWPALAFRRAAAPCRSVLLASRTLSPLDSFSSELGTDFALTMSGAPIFPPDRLFASFLTKGPNGEALTLTRDNTASPAAPCLQELARIVVAVCERVPGGVLVFAPSYRLMSHLRDALIGLELRPSLSEIKVIIEEQRDAKKNDSAVKEFKRAAKEPTRNNRRRGTGAVLFAVLRGKVSEGIDFSDDQARCVITIGIPLANIGDPQIAAKKKFNTCWGDPMLRGPEWLYHQAYRALNQALGRCMRHRADWGAVLLVDERIPESNYPPSEKSKVSQWANKACAENFGLRADFKGLMKALEEFVASRTEEDVAERREDGPSAQ